MALVDLNGSGAALVAASDAASDSLSGIAGMLATPVHIVAVLVLVVLAFEVGRLAMEAWRRIRPQSRPVEELASAAMAHPEDAAALARAAPGPPTEQAVRELAAAAEQSSQAEASENALAHYELRIQRRLDRTRMLVRAGPALGLMGTLIPLAPGLRALGDGDYKQLAGDLETAFAATVVGIMVGTGAYAVTLLRTRMYTEDLAGLERAVAARAPEAPAHHRLPATVGGDVT
jgi:biopolymer transport protein ExbB/TolQ